MKRHIIELVSGVLKAAGQVPGVWFVMVILISCQPPSDQQSQEQRYTCSMHPEVVRNAPGQCPVCGMDLILRSQVPRGKNELMLNATQMKLANITTEKVSRKPIGETVVVNGTLVVDQRGTEVVGGRVAGRIEKLYIKETGRVVKLGQPLYSMYSEALITLQQEYLLAKEQYELLGDQEPRYVKFFQAAKKKLLLFGLSERQIENMGEKNAVQQNVIFLSPADGVVTSVNVSEGQYIPEGAVLFAIEKIQTLWLEAELYPTEASVVKVGDPVTIKVNGFESMPLIARTDFLSPEYRANTQVTILRATVENTGMQFQPGMSAQVLLSHSTKEALVIPVDAVIRDGRGTHVYVQTSDNTFEPRMVKTGLEGFEQVEIVSGLVENEVVAITGAYLLYSELILKKGMDPMAGHHHEETNLNN